MMLSAMIGEESIPSKQGLREDRRHKLLRWLREQTPPLRLEEYPFWSDEQKAAEAEAFAAFDAEYESAKAALRERLLVLSEEEFAEYFSQIGWEPVGETVEEQVDHYLTNA